MSPNPFDIAELALIETSRLQRYAIVFAIDDTKARSIAAACAAEIARRDAPCCAPAVRFDD